MNLKEFLKEERQTRKQMREERKRKNKTPLTKKQKIYKIIGIIFVLAVIFGSIIYSCNGLSGGYDWNSLNGITNEIKTKLSQEVDEEKLFLGLDRITDNDLQSVKNKLKTCGVQFDDVKNDQLTLTQNLELNSKEVGSFAESLLGDLYTDKNIQVEYFLVYNIGDVFYEKSIIKIDLKKFINSELPQIYITTISKFEVQNKELTALNYTSNINNLTAEDSIDIFKVLNRNCLTFTFEKMASDKINLAMNVFSVMTSTKMILESNAITFCN